MKINRENILNIIMVFFFICVVFYVNFKIKDRKEHLVGKETVYAIGEITDFERGPKGSDWFTFEFYIDDKLHKGRHNIEGKLSTESNSFLRKFIGMKYLIIYSPEKPIYHEMYLNRPIPDSIPDCLKCTWKEMQEWARNGQAGQKEERFGQ